jgi:hypothetical protein
VRTRKENRPKLPLRFFFFGLRFFLFLLFVRFFHGRLEIANAFSEAFPKRREFAGSEEQKSNRYDQQPMQGREFPHNASMAQRKIAEPAELPVKSLGYAIFGVKSLIQPTNLLFTAKAATAAP